MHKTQFNFRKCLKEGATYHEKSIYYPCIRKEPCPLKEDIGCMSPFCRTPMKEQIRKDERARKSA